jgi:hypothetical protein
MANARPLAQPWTRSQLTQATPAVVLNDNRAFGVLIRAGEYGASMNEEQIEELAVFFESPFCHDLDTRSRSRRTYKPKPSSHELATSDAVPQYVLHAFAGYVKKNPEESPHRIITAILRWLEYGVPHEDMSFNYLAMFHLIADIVLSAGQERLAEFFRAMARSQLTPHLLKHERTLVPLTKLIASSRQARPKMRPLVENVLLVFQHATLAGEEGRALIREADSFFAENGRPAWTSTSLLAN